MTSTRTRTVYALALLFLLAFFFNWPYLLGGFSGDDLIFLNLLDNDPRPFSRLHGMWSVNQLPFIDNTWWKDWTHPGDAGVFWRPIPSLVFEGSISLFGRNAFPLHLLSILLHAGVAMCLYLLVRRVTGRRILALLSGLFFVTCEDHSMQVGWIAGFTDLLCVQFIMLALLAHVSWLRRRKALALAGSLSALILAMGCKESASVAPLAMILLSFLMPSGSSDDSSRYGGLRSRFITVLKAPSTWLPSVVVLGGYLITYRLLDMGGFDSLVYVNPLAHPGRYLARLVTQLPVLWTGTFSPIPPSLTMFWPDLLAPLAVSGLVLFLVWLVALRPFRSAPLVQWAMILYLVALLPQLAADASERALYFPMIPAAILLATVAATIAPIARRGVQAATQLPRFTRVVGWIAVLGVLLPGVLASTAAPWTYRPSFEMPLADLRTAMPFIEEHQPRHTMLLNTSGFMLTLYTWDAVNYLSEEPQDVWTLSSANAVFTLEKTGDSSFVISADRSGWLGNMFARILRTKPTLAAGDQYHTPVFDATIVRTTATGRDALAVRFDLVGPLDDPRWLFLRWNGRQFEPLNIAALPRDSTIELANTSDMWKSMY
ncbi:MAG TPA: glycosyltransferase family 39 protein [Acidobacteriota bacterium]|nr:glycosyltransferase family 39 protein [Acidobacteriota bacterium]